MRKSKLVVILLLTGLITGAFGIVNQANAISTGFHSPSSNEGLWYYPGYPPTGAYVDGSGFAQCHIDTWDHKYGGYGFTLPSTATISSVIVRLDAWCTTVFGDSSEAIKLEVSVDGGTNFLPTSVTQSLTTTEATYNIDVTGWTSWTVAKINNDKIWTRVTAVQLGEHMGSVRLDWIPITVTYKLPTVITDFGCNPLTVDKTGAETTTISGYLKSEGTGIGGKTISLSYWDGASGTIGTCITAINGYFEFDWDVPIEVPNGYYVIKAEFAGDDDYLGSSAQTSAPNNLFVIPEYMLGALASLIACFSAFMVIKKRKR